MEFTAGRLSPKFFALMAFLAGPQPDPSPNRSKDATLKAAVAARAAKETSGQVRREMRLYSTLVLEMERFESAAVKFSKVTGRKIYEENFKRSTVRDFRIIAEELPGEAEAEEPTPTKKVLIARLLQVSADAHRGQGGQKRRREEPESPQRCAVGRNEDSLSRSDASRIGPKRQR